MEQTLAIIKPDAVITKNSGNIINTIEQNGFDIIAMEKKQLKKEQAQQFYAMHKERPFFGELVEYMTSGPVVIMVLEKEHAIKDWRELMGNTDPKQAKEGTIRKRFGIDISKNATHGSDSPESAQREIEQLFPKVMH